MVDFEQYAQTARKVAAEGCVLLKNDKKVLPLKGDEKVAVFGVNAFHYYKSGLGSGGMVNTEYVVSVLDALKNEEKLVLDEELLEIYSRWIEENPFDEGHGWGTTPWSQEEMPLTQKIVDEANEKNDIAVIMIGRTAGEDQDNTNSEKSYQLSAKEREMLRMVCNTFEKTVVLLNVGNIIDMNWVAEYNPCSVMYIWQGGQEGGNGVADVLTGRVTPCGKLTDTIAQNISDYPSDKQFGNEEKNYYAEDIYVGYRYFSSTSENQKKVLYPFGYGLSYSDFTMEAKLCAVEENEIKVEVKVTNIGEYAGKEVAQVYIGAPQGKMAKPVKVLAGFAKTKVLQPKESQVLTVECPKSYFASFDEETSAFVLEEGIYKVFAGSDVDASVEIQSFENPYQVISQCQKALAPVESFERLVLKDGSFLTETVQKTEYCDDSNKCDFKEIKQNFATEYQLKDVFEKKVSLEEFLAQLTDEDLIHLSRGEGMCSMKVTPGTAGAFGGLTPHLKKLGVPALCCADGPSGIRMDCGTIAFSLPNGTLIGCTFDLELAKELFRFVGEELKDNRVDTILGPGINIHRHPLNGRNFEYFSEDPILTGLMCVAQLQGLHENGVTGTIKHFCANNQEKNRTKVEAVISERALREIYLKGYEMAVKEANARSIMTTYGPVNGLWTAGSYDLCTKILREDWKYDGIVMTDWWAVANWFGEDADKLNRAAMVIAQNDVFMLCADTVAENDVDNVKAEFESGRLTRAMLQRNAYNILKFALQSPALDRLMHKAQAGKNDSAHASVDMNSDDFACFTFPNDADTLTISFEEHKEMLSRDGAFFGVVLDDKFEYEIGFEYKTVSGELAQIPISVFSDNIYRGTFSLRGTDGKVSTYKERFGHFAGPNHYMKIQYKPNEIDIINLTLTR